MSKMLKMIVERAATTPAGSADALIELLATGLEVDEMRNKRGADYSKTQFYQLRVKPREKGKDLEGILSSIYKLLKSAKGKKLGITEVQINKNSRNSGKYSSVSFNNGSFDFDVVVAQGGNAGENFEKEMLLKMDNLVAGIDDSEEAKAAFTALASVDKEIKMSNIVSVTARSGSTQRSGDMSPEETGKIIADIIIELKNGKKKYVSLKNKAGSTVAQFGVSKAFKEDLTVDTASSEWKSWLAPFNLDPKKINEGLIAARDKTEVKWADIDTSEKKLKKGSAIHKIMEKMWGAGYIYLRETSGGFKAMVIDSDYVNNDLLAGLKVTEVRYPSNARKQISITLESEKMKFKLEIRNPRGKGEVRPTQIQLTIMKGAT